jgi:hypothetical protein
MSGDTFTFDDPEIGSVQLRHISPERHTEILSDARSAASRKAAQISRGSQPRRELRKRVFTALSSFGVLQAAVVDDDLRRRLGLDDPSRVSDASLKADRDLLLRLAEAVSADVRP